MSEIKTRSLCVISAVIIFLLSIIVLTSCEKREPAEPFDFELKESDEVLNVKKISMKTLSEVSLETIEALLPESELEKNPVSDYGLTII